ncbi:hypothetical protein KEM55_003119 [Ascosphaera atra]|nr:hypothetical protein KEM55_003119 [Ascosphaera atra]
MAVFRSSYYTKDYRAGPALLRARRPYLVKNAVTDAFTINSVGQDDFSDVKIPETPQVPQQQQQQKAQ